MSEVNNILESFNEEVNNIKEYIEFLEESVMVNISNRDDINDINDVFKQIDELRVRNNVEIKLRDDELNKINLTEIPSKYQQFIKSEIGEGIIDLIFFGIRKSKSIENEEIIKNIEVELNTFIEVESKFEDSHIIKELEGNIEKLNEYIELSKIIYNKKRYDINKKEIKLLENYNRALSLIDTSKNINIYRQSFIQLVAIFDSILFDILRVKFYNDFFNWIGNFAEGNVKYKDISKFENIEEFISSIVDDKLKGASLKDLIKIINDKNIELFIINDKKIYSELLEIICRRNSHIHNNGIVDTGYILGTNLYNKTPGDYLEVDKAYFEKTLLYCTHIIQNINRL